MIERYCRKEMKKIWENENKFRVWLDIEIAASEANAELGVIPKEAFNDIKTKANFDLKRIDEIESQVHHDVIAFTTSVSSTLMVKGTLASELRTIFWPTRLMYSATIGSSTTLACFSTSAANCLPMAISFSSE